MSDDIIKEQAQMMTEFRNRFPNAITIEDAMRQMILMSDEIELLRDALIECESTISRLEIELKYKQ